MAVVGGWSIVEDPQASVLKEALWARHVKAVPTLGDYVWGLGVVVKVDEGLGLLAPLCAEEEAMEGPLGLHVTWNIIPRGQWEPLVGMGKGGRFPWQW